MDLLVTSKAVKVDLIEDFDQEGADKNMMGSRPKTDLWGPSNTAKQPDCSYLQEQGDNSCLVINSKTNYYFFPFNLTAFGLFLVIATTCLELLAVRVNTLL